MITAVAAAMKLSSKVEVAALREVLLPCLLCSAVYKNNFDIVESCHQEHADLSAGRARHTRVRCDGCCPGDYDMRTPLHIAAAEGNLAMAQFLLERGALVHKKAGSYFYTGRSDY